MRHYFEVSNYAYATGDVEPMDRLALPDCAACAAFKRDVDSVYPEGRILGGHIKVKATVTGALVPGEPIYTYTSYSETAYRAERNDGTVIETASPLPAGEFRVELAWTVVGWRIVSIRPVTR